MFKIIKLSTYKKLQDDLSSYKRTVWHLKNICENLERELQEEHNRREAAETYIEAEKQKKAEASCKTAETRARSKAAKEVKE